MLICKWTLLRLDNLFIFMLKCRHGRSTKPLKDMVMGKKRAGRKNYIFHNAFVFTHKTCIHWTLLYKKSKKNPAFHDMSPLTTCKRTFILKHICVKSVTEIREVADAFLIWTEENRNDEGGNQDGERNENMSHTQ